MLMAESLHLCGVETHSLYEVQRFRIRIQVARNGTNAQQEFQQPEGNVVFWRFCAKLCCYLCQEFSQAGALAIKRQQLLGSQASASLGIRPISARQTRRCL